MRTILYLMVLGAVALSGCKKKFCGKISMISTETSPANGQPLYKLYLESGEVVAMKSRGSYQVGEGYCND